MTDDQIPPDLLKVREIITTATSRLDPDDYNARIAWCRQHDQHGVRLHLDPNDDILEFRWGGRTLAMVPRAILQSDEPLPEPRYITATPDTIPDEWDDQ